MHRESGVPDAPAKVQGKLSAPVVVIGKKADVQFFRQLHVGSIEIRGKMIGRNCRAKRSSRFAALDHSTATSSRARSTWKKAARFSGQLAIGQKSWEQAELLAEVESTKPLSNRESAPAASASFRFAGDFLDLRAAMARTAPAQSLRAAGRLCPPAAFDRQGPSSSPAVCWRDTTTRRSALISISSLS